MKSILKRSGLVLLAFAAAIQFWPTGRANPAATSELQARPEVERILRRSCYDCHSNETRWPWYGYVAPVSWWLVHDVDEGRAELNFSNWGALPPLQREKRAERCVEEIEKGHMPLKGYLRLHGGSQVAQEDLEILRAWAREQSVSKPL